MRRTVFAGTPGRIALIVVAFVLPTPSLSGLTVGDAPGTTLPPNPTTPKPNLSWAIDPPAATWYLGPGQNRGAEFVVTISAASKITSLRVTHSTMLDSDTGRGVSLSAERFHICASSNEPIEQCTESVNAVLKEQLSKLAGTADKAQTSAARVTLWLVVDAGVVPDGTFTGNLFIDSEPVSDTKTLQLTIQHTTPRAKTWGVVWIMAGVFMAWVITVFARSRVNRDQALLPVAVLQQKIEAIKHSLGAIHKVLQDSVPDTQKALKTVTADLSTANLDNLQLLPPSVPPMTPSTTQAAALQSFLQARSQLVDNLDVIVTGIGAADALADPPVADTKLAGLKALVKNIDLLSASLPQSSDALRTNIQGLFNTFNAQPQAQVAGAPPRLLAMPDGSPLSAFNIRMEIQTISLLFWAVWGGLSVVSGFIVLVMPAAGFGTTADFLRCSLWGFGLPVAGQGLQSLTMSSINTQLGVTLPK